MGDCGKPKGLHRYVYMSACIIMQDPWGYYYEHGKTWILARKLPEYIGVTRVRRHKKYYAMLVCSNRKPNITMFMALMEVPLFCLLRCLAHASGGMYGSHPQHEAQGVQIEVNIGMVADKQAHVDIEPGIERHFLRVIALRRIHRAEFVHRRVIIDRHGTEYGSATWDRKGWVHTLSASTA